jgi:oligopeptide/dipeptide ABC transporter ATP-binding protein
MSAAVLEVTELTTVFGRGAAEVTALAGVSFSVAAGETLVLLGESGSGKSVTARSILGLHGPNARVGGGVRLAGTELVGAHPRVVRAVRGARVALVPQDPAGALDPLRGVGGQIAEVLLTHRAVPSRAAARVRALELLRDVGIPDPRRVARSRPHQLSGGMRQRVVIAIAVSCGPEVLIADEPTTALDVTVQAQVLELFADLCARRGTALVLVTHDVGVAEQAGDRIGVMYAGRLVEIGPARDVIADPRHPYTAALLGALPVPGVPRGGLRVIPGAPPAGGPPPAGCAFAPRCAHAVPDCRTARPPLAEVAPGRAAACPVAVETPLAEVTA